VGTFFSVFFSHAQHRGSRSTKTEKTKKKLAEAENNELKTNTELHPVVFAYLATQPHVQTALLFLFSDRGNN
jgi:hypothetical protein